MKAKTEKGMTVARAGSLVLVAVSVWVLHVAFSSRAAAAEPSTRPSESANATASLIKTWFNDLASPDAQVRNEAHAGLMGLAPDQLPVLRKAVEENRPLVASQASVLRQIVTQIFLSGEHYDGVATEGFLGIRMEEARITFNDDAPANDGRPPSTGVVIIERMPGFAGARVLRDGDVVLGIEEFPNTPLRRPADFALAVKDKGAGTELHFQVLRQGQVIRLTVKLDARPFDANIGFGGSMEDLLERRRIAAEEYWGKNFAKLLKEKVS